MAEIRFDYNNMFGSRVGSSGGISERELSGMRKALRAAHAHLTRVIAHEGCRVNAGLEWAVLPFQDEKTVSSIQRMGREIASTYRNVLFLGIGGSYLGLKAAQDALVGPYHNEFASGQHRGASWPIRSGQGQRRGASWPIRSGQGPRIFFEGNNLDPETLSVLLRDLDPRETFVVVISKSGETTETKGAFLVVEEWLRKRVGSRYGRQVIAVTDPTAGSLRRLAREKNDSDRLSFRTLPLLKGVGGRYSELNMGLLHLAVNKIPLADVLGGARAMSRRCMREPVQENPALFYAALHYLLCKKKRKPIAVLMPFSETLASTADWYVQLLAESLGKRYGRVVRRDRKGVEEWLADKRRVVRTGRTPVAARGTNDLHSIQQLIVEGPDDKVVTFIQVGTFRSDITVPPHGGLLGGKSFTRLMSLAKEATEWALVRARVPNCTVAMPEVSPSHWGGLLYFFEMATAFEGELLGINAFDQPGVEGYKQYLYGKLGSPDLSPAAVAEIRRHPLVKKRSLIL